MSASVFPAYVGMSPTVPAKQKKAPRVPRIRGDEPYLRGVFTLKVLCSPHTWG